MIANKATEALFKRSNKAGVPQAALDAFNEALRAIVTGLGVPQEDLLTSAMQQLVIHNDNGTGYALMYVDRTVVAMPPNIGQINNTNLMQLWEAYCARSSELSRERGIVTGRIRALLDDCATTKQVLEVWPDGEPFLAAYFERDAGTGTPETVLLKRRQKAAEIAKLFLEAGIDVETPTEVPEEQNAENQAA
jgi:hypothetical protein